jgi:xylulokinase
MNTDALLLGIDVGTTNCKALLFDLDGRPQATSHALTPTYHPRPNWAEHDPEALWNTVAALVRQVVAGIDPARVRGVGVASMAEAGVLLDTAGRPTYPIIAWHDSRTLLYHRQWIDHVETRDSFAIAGIRPEPIYGVYKLMWLRDHAPEAYRSAARWLHVADYIVFRLCGVPVTDPSLATRTMLFDLQRRTWSDRLVEWAQVRADVLPEVVPSGTALGGVTVEAAATTGLQPGTVVASGGHDHVCGALAAGVREPGTCLDSLGTAEAVFLPLASVQLDDALSQTGCMFGTHVARDRYYTMDGLWSGGGAIEWVRSMLALPTTNVPTGGYSCFVCAPRSNSGASSCRQPWCVFFAASCWGRAWGVYRLERRNKCCNARPRGV